MFLLPTALSKRCRGLNRPAKLGGGAPKNGSNGSNEAVPCCPAVLPRVLDQTHAVQPSSAATWLAMLIMLILAEAIPIAKKQNMPGPTQHSQAPHQNQLLSFKQKWKRTLHVS